MREAQGTLGSVPRRQKTSTTGFVCFAGEDWWYHNHAHADFQLALQIARTRPTLVVNSIGMRMPTASSTTRPATRILRKLRSSARLLRRPIAERPMFHVYTPVSVPVFGRPLLERANSAFVALQVRAAMALSGIGSHPDMLVTVPTAITMARRLRPSRLGYLRADNHAADPEVDTELITGFENLLFEHSDRVFYSSAALMDNDLDRHRGKGVLFEHGVDLDLFTPSATGDEPADLATIARPRLGFFGTIEPQGTDLDLLVHVARSLPECNLVLIGRPATDVSRLEALANVHVLGYRDHGQIPAYGSGFDVALLPRPSTQWNAHSNPIKLREYLALGLTVVSTDFPEGRRMGDLVRIGVGPDGFVEAIRAALRAPVDPLVARAAVASSSWAARAVELLEALDGRPADPAERSKAVQGAAIAPHSNDEE